MATLRQQLDQQRKPGRKAASAHRAQPVDDLGDLDNLGLDGDGDGDLDDLDAPEGNVGTGTGSDDDSDGDDDAGDDTGEGDGTGDDWQPPSREEWEATQAKLKRARTQAQKLRERNAGKNGAATTGDGEAGTRDEETERELEKWQVRAIRSDARAALLERGADPDLVELALAKLKPSEVDFDQDDDPILDDWLDDMEERYPRVFVPRRPERPAGGAQSSRAGAGRRVGGIDQSAASGGRQTATPPAKTMSQKLRESSIGGRRPR